HLEEQESSQKNRQRINWHGEDCASAHRQGRVSTGHAGAATKGACLVAKRLECVEQVAALHYVGAGHMRLARPRSRRRADFSPQQRSNTPDSWPLFAGGACCGLKSALRPPSLTQYYAYNFLLAM